MVIRLCCYIFTLLYKLYNEKELQITYIVLNYDFFK